MVVGYKPEYGDNDQALYNQLLTTQKWNVKLSYDKLQYKQHEVDFFGEICATDGH